MSAEMEKQLSNILQDLDSDPDGTLLRLVDFIKDYSVDKKLRIHALTLAGEMRAARRSGLDQSFSDDLRTIADRVQIEQSSPTLDTSLNARRAAKERFSGRQIDDRVVVESKGLGKRFDQFELKDVDLRLRLGKITGVVGENANGKTTLFRILVGELKQSQGEITYPELGAANPHDINWAEVRRQIAYVPQSLAAWHGSLEDNLRFAASSRGITGAANDEAFDYTTTRLGLREYLDRTWHEISGGYQLRFELARALIWRPKLLALDEPLANLDFKAQLTLLRDVKALARSFTDPIAVVISSQHLHEVEAVADDIMFLRRGEVVFNGPISDVGKSRSLNTFEMNVNASVPEIKAALAHLPVNQIYFNGLSFVLEGGLELTSGDVLNALSAAKIEISYFRDLSRSVKQLFEQTPFAS